ncbi:MAG: Nif3-like dinuclear metal center hexameric protein [Candidatus Izimaplasma sp.]|nr:Nif3-like dinuclear metal center hexameric protein [Candidatus Izimaplasma bacterium]
MERNNIKLVLDQLFKPELAADWDNVGLQIGSLKAVTKILVTLDVTHEVINEAKKKDCDMIIAHHPLLFKPQKDILNDTPIGDIIYSLIQNNISLYVAHTNFDVLPNGMNDALAKKLSLEKPCYLEETVEGYGLGMVGTLKTKQPLKTYIASVKETFNLSTVSFIGKLDQHVQTIAIVGGSGASVIQTAVNKNVDLLITGDVTYHHALEANALGLPILNVNHNIEFFGVKQMASMLEDAVPDISIVLSQINTNPYKII